MRNNRIIDVLFRKRCPARRRPRLQARKRIPVRLSCLTGILFDRTVPSLDIDDRGFAERGDKLHAGGIEERGGVEIRQARRRMEKQSGNHRQHRDGEIGDPAQKAPLPGGGGVALCLEGAHHAHGPGESVHAEQVHDEEQLRIVDRRQDEHPEIGNDDPDEQDGLAADHVPRHGEVVDQRAQAVGSQRDGDDDRDDVKAVLRVGDQEAGAQEHQQGQQHLFDALHASHALSLPSVPRRA